MLKPKYKRTNTLLTNIAEIERLYGQIEAIRIPEKLELNLKRDNLIKSTYASNRIEGNPLTLPEVTNLLLDERVPVNRDEKEVVNYFQLLSELKNFTEREISLELIKEIHKRVLEGVDKSAGDIRNRKVVIGKYTSREKTPASLKVKHDPPFHKRKKIEGSLNNLLQWTEKTQKLPTIIKTGIFHHEFVYIHPFEDGNGRVCRMLTALLFIKEGYMINKYFVLDDYYDIDKTLYSDKLHSADQGEKTEWLEYFSDGVKYSLMGALDRAKNAARTLSIKDRPSKKENEVLEIMKEQPEMTSSELAEVLKVTRQQAHNLLSALVKKGLIERKGTTKSSFYRLK
jgi:Fic family protein